MKAKVIITSILAGVCLLAASQVFSHNFEDAPHNSAIMATSPSGQCTTCHSIGGAFGASGSFPDYATDAVCTSCHTDTLSTNPALTPYLIQAPAVQTHNGPKHAAPNVCIDCHTTGYQAQVDWIQTIPALEPRVRLVEGTITSMKDNGDGTSTFGYSNIVVNKDASDLQAPDWSDLTLWGNKSGMKWGPNKDQTRGLIFIDLNTDRYTFEVKSATSTAITVKGSWNLLAAFNASLPPMNVGDSFALIYGQIMHGPAIPGGLIFDPQFMFFQNSGLFSFANNPPPTDIQPCVVCHTQTNHWRNFTVDPNRLTADHNANSKCTVCHPHEKGFSPSGACNTCHGYPPTVATLGGPDGLANNPAVTGATTPGSHGRHATNTAGGYNYPCDKCHTGGMPASPVTDYKIQIGFNISPSYQGGTYNGRTLATGFTYAAGNAATIINPTPPAGVPTQSCTNIYCHSNAKVGTAVASYATPWWTDGPLACNACHQYPPSYASGAAGSPTANSHVPHVTTNGFGCEKCHSNTVSASGIVNITFHANANIDVFFDSSNPDGTYNTATKTCSTLACHGTGTPQWGQAGSSITCQSCHLGAADVDNFSGTFWNNGIMGVISTSEWSSTGHGATAPYASGNPAAAFTTANGCTYCHDNSVGHKNGTNPFRLRNITDGTWGKNGNCQLCHATGSAGVTVDSVLKNATKKVGSTHFGTKHGAANNGGQFCWDCHDPHGDTNRFMVHAAVAKTSDSGTGAPTNPVPVSFVASSTGTDYATSSAPFNKICNACHTTTNHYTSTSGDGHNSGTRCTQCHKHTGDTTTDAFKPGGNNCFDCHSSAGGPTPGTVPDAYHQRHVKTAFVGLVSTGDYGNSAKGWYRYSNTGDSTDMGCGYCHPQSSTTHMNGVINLNFDPNDAGAAGTLKAKNGTPQVFTQVTRSNVTCSSAYCHSNGYNPGTGYGYKTSDNWYTVTVSGDVCAKCHGNSPTGSSAHAAHVVGIHYNTIYTGTSGLATAGNTPTGSHGNPGTSTTINCNICHFNTVTMSANDLNAVCITCHTGSILKGTMAVAAGSTTHVNGTVDVTFNPIAVLSKAQLRDSIASVPELANNWTRPAGYKVAGSYDKAVNALNTGTMYASGTKTCSNIACHNGNQVKWTDAVSCNQCHTALPQ